MSAESQPIVLVHGLWMTPRSWDKFAERYPGAGPAMRPAWPGLEVRRRHAATRRP